MALPYKFTGGVGTKSRGVIDAIEKQLKSVTLKPAKKLTFSYNPFCENVDSVRQASVFLHRPQVRETNVNCIFKSIVHNTSDEPLLEVNLVSGKTVLFKTENLTALEIIQKYNHLIRFVPEKVKK